MSVGERAIVTPELLRVLREQYGLNWRGDVMDLGGSVNLNVHLPTEDGGFVARIYCPWTSSERLGAIQSARSRLAEKGVPLPETVAARNGATQIHFDGRVLEVERHVSGEPMDTWNRLLHGMNLLGHIHRTLQGMDADESVRNAPYANYVSPDRALPWTLEAAAQIRRQSGLQAELRLAEVAEKLAHELAGVEPEMAASLPKQLVHGDFWDNNVLFRD